MNYKQTLTEMMGTLSKIKNSVFIGQQILWKGNPMSTTLDLVDRSKMIETPVMEETQMGMSMGLAMRGHTVVTFYPRWDFLILAVNQLINHIDKYEFMMGDKLHMIIRVGKGADEPLDPGHQHKGNYFNEIKSMCKTIQFFDCVTKEDVKNSYDFAIKNKGIYLINEYPQYYENE